MRIVFMGTPEFAVPSLRRLCERGEDVCGVFTQPDRPSGRGNRLTPPPVKVFAGERGIPVHQPESMKGEAIQALLDELAPDVLVVAAYGQILPARILAVPRLAPLNVHASLLPALRGAAPIQWAIIRGEEKTGITIMRMVRRLDAGDILLQAEEPIRLEDTSRTLHDRLGELGGRCLSDALDRLREGRAEYHPQDEARVTWAPSLTREDARVDWNEPAKACHDRIRGLTPWPGVVADFRGAPCKILRAAPAAADDATPARPSGALAVKGGTPRVRCGDGRDLELLLVQLPGRPAVSGSDFVNGRRLRDGERLL